VTEQITLRLARDRESGELAQLGARSAAHWRSHDGTDHADDAPEVVPDGRN
jgi:hypothetical protein